MRYVQDFPQVDADAVDVVSPLRARDLVPPGHVAHFVRDTVGDDLDLSAILDAYTEERGYPP